MESRASDLEVRAEVGVDTDKMALSEGFEFEGLPLSHSSLALVLP